MLRNCVKSIIKWRPLSCYQSVLSPQFYSSFATKDILYETSDEAGTLLTRFAKHVALERLSICDQVPTKVHYSDYFPISDLKYFQRQLQTTSADQLAAVIVFASTYRSNADPSKFAMILNEIDRFATDNVRNMNVDTILRTLYAFLFLIPNWMTRLDFYSKSMQHMFEQLLREGCTSKEIFVQVSFYAGLAKKQSRLGLDQFWKTFLDAHFEKFLPQMSTLDLAIVSNAAYKTSTIIGGQSYNQRLVKEALEVSAVEEVGNDSLFINFIKSMRLQRVRSNEVCDHLTQICTDARRLKTLQPRGQMHIFAYLADNLWDSEDCMQPLINQFMKSIKSSGRSSFAQSVRGKDVATFLWCCAQLNCSITEEQFRAIENCLINKVHNKEFNYFPDQLVEACLSLWVLGHKSEELFHHAIQLKSNSPHKRQQPKVDSRLTVLLSAVQIENPTWCSNETKGFEPFNIKTKVPAYLLEGKEIPYNQIISQLNEENIVSSATIASPINGINIPGIFVKLSTPTDSDLFVEFMTPSQTLQFSRQPVFILRLKLRLLQSMGYKAKVVCD